LLVGVCLALGGGCASGHGRLERALLADGNPAAHTRDLDAHYRLRCPDVLEVRIDGRPDLSGPRAVGPDGRIRLDSRDAIRVAGQTAPGVAHSLAHRLGVAEQGVHVRVAEHRSQSLYLFSDVNSAQKVVPYRGPETVIDLLQRVGGTAPGSALGDVQVVRAHVADGRPPEVFHVNLRAILLEHDLRTNVHLQQGDRIYIGQSRRSRLACCVPTLLQPLYRHVCGLQE
jgi:protein involved in polysaccharide export with SLBB domain